MTKKKKKTVKKRIPVAKPSRRHKTKKDYTRKKAKTNTATTLDKSHKFDEIHELFSKYYDDTF